MKFCGHISLWVVLSLLLSLSSAEGFFHGRGRARSGEEENFKKLRLEKPKSRIVAPDFTLKELSGKPITLEGLRGKVVFLNFWATWCPPCVIEMPSMEKLHQEFGNDGLVILAINFRETPEQVKAFVKKHKLTFSTVLDREGEVFELYQAWGLPMTTIINKRGEIAGRAMGYRDWHSADARGVFRQLLAEKS
jgi:peroxiredoxin